MLINVKLYQDEKIQADFFKMSGQVSANLIAVFFRLLVTRVKLLETHTKYNTFVNVAKQKQ